MVRIFVVSEYSQHPPEDGKGRVKMAKGPLYDLARVQKLAAAGGAEYLDRPVRQDGV